MLEVKTVLLLFSLVFLLFWCFFCLCFLWAYDGLQNLFKKCVCVCEPPCPPRAASVSFTADECTEFKHLMQGDVACNQEPCPTKLPDCMGSKG